MKRVTITEKQLNSLIFAFVFHCVFENGIIEELGEKLHHMEKEDEEYKMLRRVFKDSLLSIGVKVE